MEKVSARKQPTSLKNTCEGIYFLVKLQGASPDVQFSTQSMRNGMFNPSVFYVLYGIHIFYSLQNTVIDKNFGGSAASLLVVGYGPS